MKTGEQVTPGNNLGCSVCMYLMLRLMLLLMWAQSYSDHSALFASRFLLFGGDGSCGSHAGMFHLNMSITASTANGNVGSILQ